jgi:hypothetical protein
MKSLERLIAPVPVDRFDAEFWERAHLHVRRGDPGYFEPLFTLDELDAILARDDLRYPAIQVFLNGEQLEATAFIRTWHYGRQSYRDMIDMDRIYALFDRGATLNILGLERLSPGVGAMNRGLEADSGFPVHTTAFLTPSGAANIPPHYDMVDFFTLQISGTKRWRLWRSETGLPLVEDKKRTYPDGHPALAAEHLLDEVTLEPGDTLFVPRGMIHKAVTSERHSLHVTIGINPYRRWDALETLIRSAVGALSAEPEARRALPPVPKCSDPAVREFARRRFSGLLDSLARGVEDGRADAFRTLDSRLIASRYPARPGQLVTLAEGVRVNPGDLVRRRPDVVSRLAPNGERWRLEFQNKTLSLGPSLGPLIKAARAAESFRPADLPGTLALEQKCAFVERLIREGYLEPVPAPGRPQEPAASRALG